MLQPGSDVGGIGLGLVRCVRPWDEWLIVWGYDIASEPPVVDEAFATKVVRDLVGDATLDVQLLSTSLWGNNKWYATENRRGRVFAMGDATHRHPPSNGLGSNTSIQDAYNLAWKLAHVLQGKAGPGLLDSYQPERAPVAEQIVLRANKSIEEFGPIFEALGLVGTNDPEEMRARIDDRADDTPEARAKREALHEGAGAQGLRVQRPRRGAQPPLRQRRGRPRRHPGARLRPRPRALLPPDHVAGRAPAPRLARAPRRHRPHPAVAPTTSPGKGRWTLFTGIGGEDWAVAAQRLSAELGVEVHPAVVGPGRAYTDLYDDWARLRETDEDGCVLVRPDAHVAWRSLHHVDDAYAALRDVLCRVLDRTLPEA